VNGKDQFLASNRAIWILAASIAVLEAALLLLQFGRVAAIQFTDADDAMRLVLVRDLLNGHAWFDLRVDRINPPLGVYLHWSRLVDGAEAATIYLLGGIFSSSRAELIGREIFPLICLLPACAAALFIARNFGGKWSVLVCAALLPTEGMLYRQFRPGRIDHHDLQITFALISMAVATLPRPSPRLAALAGASTALGLAIGFEGLPLQIAIGVTFVLRFLLFDDALTLACYSGSAATFSLIFFLLQTPPALVLVSQCDALAINTVVGIVLSGGALCLVALKFAKITGGRRYGLTFLAMGLGALTCLAIHPSCLHGPLADINPAWPSAWTSKIQELMSIPEFYGLNAGAAIHAAVMMAAAIAASLFLLARGDRSFPAVVLVIVLAVTAPLAYLYWRSQDYLFWIGIPAFSAALGTILPRITQSPAIAVAASILLSPLFVTTPLLAVAKARTAPVTQAPPSCMNFADYRQLTALKRGVIFSDVDLGAPILAMTPHSVLTAGYHRLSDQLVRIARIEWGPSDDAKAGVLSTGADYVVDCAGLPSRDHGFLFDLRHGRDFPWLHRLSPPNTAIQIWRVTDGQ
jgi:hypothetical protein